MPRHYQIENPCSYGVKETEKHKFQSEIKHGSNPVLPLGLSRHFSNQKSLRRRMT
jgi:hypothetical protein